LLGHTQGGRERGRGISVHGDDLLTLARVEGGEHRGHGGLPHPALAGDRDLERHSQLLEEYAMPDKVHLRQDDIIEHDRPTDDIGAYIGAIPSPYAHRIR